ncbi:MAG: hypothetical protein F4Z65_09545 [Acidobacteria bacterium]|nr:hypothetical protein [Acidobacteriota bacterium]MYA45415.1 hypothetical protein [Acidobacteriota bacterium]MYI40337.1 hypothetical protein [Acidobacteriota bacterium]
MQFSVAKSVQFPVAIVTASVTLLMEFTAGSEAVAFDWLGPYEGARKTGRAGFQIVMVDWTTERIPGAPGMP